MTSVVELRPAGPVEPLDRRVTGLAAVGLGGFALAGIYQLSGGHIGIPCILRVTTGLDCPLCGGTRMAAALLQGDLAAAWHFNGLVLILGPLIGVAVGYQLLSYSLDRLRLIRIPRLRMSPRLATLTTRAMIVALVVFGIARNLN